MNHKLAIITVVYNNYQILEDFTNSLKSQPRDMWELFIVDVSDKMEPIPAYDFNITLIEEKNGGYAYGVNAGIKKAREKGYDLFCVINADTYVHPDFVHNVTNTLIQHPGSLIGGKIYYAPRYEYHRSRYTEEQLGKVFWYAGGEIDWDHSIGYHIAVDEVDNGQRDTFTETGFITGCMMAYDSEVLKKVGEWDDHYFLYYEDTDFCERAKRRGIKLYYDPNIILWHKNAQSTGGSGSSLHEKYQKKSQLRFAMQYAPLRTKLHVMKNYFLR